MAFATKTDYCGLATAFSSSLVVKDSALNGSSELYQPQGPDGSFLGMEVYGADTAPTNNYGVKATINASAGDLKLNKITAVGSGDTQKNYSLESITITTAAAAAPTIAATCQEIETTATDANQCHYSVPAFTLTTKQHAQNLFSAFTISGTGCNLTDCQAVISCSINKDKVAGTKIASDANSGLITVSGTILATGSTDPTITAAEGWVLTKFEGTEQNPETEYRKFTFEVQKALTKDAS